VQVQEREVRIPTDFVAFLQAQFPAILNTGHHAIPEKVSSIVVQTQAGTQAQGSAGFSVVFVSATEVQRKANAPHTICMPLLHAVVNNLMDGVKNILCVMRAHLSLSLTDIYLIDFSPCVLNSYLFVKGFFGMPL